MASLGSWIRFILGIVLAAEIIRNWLFAGGILSIYSKVLAVVFLLLSATYFIFRF